MSDNAKPASGCTVEGLVRFWLRCRHAVWRWRFKRFIAETRGWNPGVRAICLAAGTWESVAFVHDALFRESNVNLHRTKMAGDNLEDSE